ncbi:MAG: hypothetical protein PUE67_01045 [Oscillospiraceae bacterium]|nr:hypothetical protein [Oscillospiraceae bacterium]
MNLTHQEITLDVNDSKNTVVLSAHQGDKGTRFIDVTLTQSGEIIPMSNTFTATAKASLFGMVKGLNKCEVDTADNKIIVELTDTMLDTPGRLNCEITLSEGEQIITSQIFSVDVTGSVVDGIKEIARDADLAKLQRAIFLVGELSELENLAELDNMATTAYNRFVQYIGEDVDLNVSDITDTFVVNLYNCNVTNAPVTGAISGTVVNLSYKVGENSYIVQFLIMENNYTYKRSCSTENSWTSWVIVADDMSQYLKTADLQGAILSDTPSDTTAYSSNKVNTLLKSKIDTVALRGADIKNVPTYLTLAQKEGNILALYFSELFNDDTPSVRTTFTGAKLDEMLSDKEDNSNKLTTGSPSYKEAQYPSIAYLEKYNYTKAETDIKIGGLINDEAVTDASTFSGSKIDEMVGNINSTIDEKIGEAETKEVSIDLTVEYGNVSGSVGNTITIGSQTYYVHTCVDVSQIKKVKVKTHRDSASPIQKYAYFTDGNDVIVATAIEYSDTSGIVTEELTVPQGAAKLYVTAGTGNKKIIAVSRIDDVPVWEGLAQKYDSSNIETGSGELISSYEGFAGNFEYTKVHNVVTARINITAVNTEMNRFSFTGLPYAVVVNDTNIRLLTATFKGSVIVAAIAGTSVNGNNNSGNFQDGEKFSFVVTYLTNV